MGRAKIDRPGLSIFLAGAVLFLGSTGLGFYLARDAQGPDTRRQANDYLSYGPGRVGVDHRDYHTKPSHVPALIVHTFMWVTFGLGVWLTLVGLRMLTRPDRDFRPSLHLGSIRDVFENPD